MGSAPTRAKTQKRNSVNLIRALMEVNTVGIGFDIIRFRSVALVRRGLNGIKTRIDCTSGKLESISTESRLAQQANLHSTKS